MLTIQKTAATLYINGRPVDTQGAKDKRVSSDLAMMVKTALRKRGWKPEEKSS